MLSSQQRLMHVRSAPHVPQPNTDARLLELITSCLVLDPTRRPTAKELMQLPYFWDVPRLLTSTGLDVTLAKAAASPALQVPATASSTPTGSAAAVAASAMQPAAVAAAMAASTAAPVAAPAAVRAAVAAGAAAAAVAGTGAGAAKPQDGPAAARVHAARNAVPAAATAGTAPTTTTAAVVELAGAASAMPAGLQAAVPPLGATAAAAAAAMPPTQRPVVPSYLGEDSGGNQLHRQQPSKHIRQEAAALAVGDVPRGVHGSSTSSSRSRVPGMATVAVAAATVRRGLGQDPGSATDTCAAAGSQQGIAVCTPSPETGCGSRGAPLTSTGVDRKFQHSLSEPGEAGLAHVATAPGLVEGAVATAAALSGPYTWDTGRNSGDLAGCPSSKIQGLNTSRTSIFSQSLQFALLQQQQQEASAREVLGRRGALPPDPMGYGALQYSASVYRQDTTECTTPQDTYSQLLSTGDTSQVKPVRGPPKQPAAIHAYTELRRSDTLPYLCMQGLVHVSRLSRYA